MSAKILIDPGHGGRDPGAVGPTRLKESDVNLAVGLRLGKLLAANGFAVTYTRTTDAFPSLTERWTQANREAVDYFVSIHANAAGPTAVGIETLHHTNSTAGRNLAAAIQRELIDRTGERDRGLKPRNNLTVLNGTKMPAVLPEIGFISNGATETKFRQAAYLELLADAIGRGIAAHLNCAWSSPAAPPPPDPMPVPPLEEPDEPTEPPNVVFSCPYCEKPIALSFGPTGELDAERHSH